MSQDRLLCMRAVSKTYGQRSRTIPVLRELSFEVQPGEFVRIVGPSGSGKTTLLHLIAALDRPDAGDIMVAGLDVARLSLRQASHYRSQRIGIVFQTYNLIPQLTAFENVLLPMIPTGHVERSRANELLALVGLTDRSSHMPSQLSGGEQQRVAIARALVNNPPVVLADEPTGNLDDENAQAIMALLLRSCRTLGNTLILVTHERSNMLGADRTLELRAGALRPIMT